jgi:hypothetical protein
MGVATPEGGSAMTPPPDKTLEELASKLRSPGCAADFLDLIEYLRRKANNPQDYIPEAVADAKHDLELLSATADLRAEVERLRRNAIVNHLMQGELETQLASERERVKELEKAATALRRYIGLAEFQEPSHQGCCGPESLCDGICQDNAWAAEKNAAISKLDKLLTTPPSATEE